MLGKHVSMARATMEVPWDADRAARVLSRALAARRSSAAKRPLGWVFALAAASLAGALFVRQPPSSDGDVSGAIPSREPRPALVGAPSDALDGGKHTG